MQPKPVDAARGWAWFVCGFRLFAAHPGAFIVLVALLTVLLIALRWVVAQLPSLGALALGLLWPALTAGLLYVAHAARVSGAPDLGQLLQPFRHTAKLARLLTFGALALAVSVGTGLLLVKFMGAPLMLMTGGAMSMDIWGAGPQVLLVLLVVLTTQLLISMLLVYAIPLAIFNDARPLVAMGSSFSACLRNALPLIVFGLPYTVVAAAASATGALGWFWPVLAWSVLLPVSAAMLYCSYQDIYPARVSS